MKLRDVIFKEAGLSIPRTGEGRGFWQWLKELILPGVHAETPLQQAVVKNWKGKSKREIQEALKAAPPAGASSGYRDHVLREGLGITGKEGEEVDLGADWLTNLYDRLGLAQTREQELLRTDPGMVAARARIEAANKALSAAEEQRNAAKAALDDFLATEVGKNTVLDPKIRAQLTNNYSKALATYNTASGKLRRAEKELTTAEGKVPGLAGLRADIANMENAGRKGLNAFNNYRTLYDIQNEVAGVRSFDEFNPIQWSPTLGQLNISRKQVNEVNDRLSQHFNARDAYNAEQEMLPQILKRNAAVTRNWILGAGLGAGVGGAAYGYHLYDNKKKEEERKQIEDFIPQGNR